jgi:tripartite ATP-independent transporter DctP family solute receptor
MMLKKSRCLVLAMVLILVLVSCTTFAATKPVKLIFGHVFQADHYYNKAILEFKGLVEKNSKGKLLVDVFPASQLGSIVEQFQAIRTGAQQMFIDGAGGLATSYPKFATFQLPYLLRDQQHYIKLLTKGMSVIDQKELTAKTGMNIIAFWPRAARQLTTNFPVNKVEDIKGLKIRVPEHPVYLTFWKTLGAIPTAVPAADMYTALATGTVDAQENPLDTIYSFKIYEVQKYIAFTAHMREVFAVYINNKTWNSLSSAQKKILTDAARKSGDMVMKAVLDGDQEYYEKMLQKGIKFTNPDVTAFREKAKTMWGQFGDRELIKKIEAIK